MPINDMTGKWLTIFNTLVNTLQMMGGKDDDKGGKGGDKDASLAGLAASRYGGTIVDEALFFHAVTHLYAEGELDDIGLKSVTKLFNGLDYPQKKKLVHIIGLGEQEMSGPAEKPTEGKGKKGKKAKKDTKKDKKKWMENKRGKEMIRGMAKMDHDELVALIEASGITTTWADTAAFYYVAIAEAIEDFLIWFDDNNIGPKIKAFAKKMDSKVYRKLGQWERKLEESHQRHHERRWFRYVYLAISIALVASIFIFYPQ